MTPDISNLSMREQQALQALIDKREVYRAAGHFIGAQVRRSSSSGKSSSGSTSHDS